MFFRCRKGPECDKLMEGFTARCIRKLRRLLFKFIVYKTIGSVLTTVKEEFGLPLIDLVATQRLFRMTRAQNLGKVSTGLHRKLRIEY